MSANFEVRYRKSNGNLHVRPVGEFDGTSAFQLIDFIERKYKGKGRIFIDTKDLDHVHPFGCGVFKCEWKNRTIPVNCLFIKGKKGFEMAPNGSKVIISAIKSPCGCNGNCQNCHCAAKKRKQNG